MNHPYEGHPTINAERASAMIATVTGQACDSHYLQFWAWPESFPSTAGPFNGIGGQAFTSFHIEAWADGNTDCVLVFCNGKLLCYAAGIRPMDRLKDLKKRRFKKAGE